MTGFLRVIAPGLMTTVQDLGRPGFQRLGVPPSGSLDPVGLTSMERLAPLQSARLVGGQLLRIGALVDSAVAYLAVEGGFALPPVLGSLSTLIGAAIGGFRGRAL